MLGDSRIPLGLGLGLVTIAATARLGKPLGTCELLLLQQEVGGRGGKERNSLLESWRKLSSVTEGWGTAEWILRHDGNLVSEKYF